MPVVITATSQFGIRQWDNRQMGGRQIGTATAPLKGTGGANTGKQAQNTCPMLACKGCMANLARALVAFIKAEGEPAAVATEKVWSDLDLGRVVKIQQNWRTKRIAIFNGIFRSDIAWDIVLELFSARMERRRCHVSCVCAMTHAPMTTVLRWIKLLEEKEIIIRNESDADGRIIWLELTENAERQLRQLFQANGALA